MKNHQFQKNTGLIGLNFHITFSHLVLAIIEFTHLNKSRITYLLQQFKFLLVVITILFDQFVLWWLYWRWVVDFLTVNTINLFFGGMAIPIRVVTRETKMTNWKSKCIVLPSSCCRQSDDVRETIAERTQRLKQETLVP